ncbi:RpiR family transcriptional regulator [Halolactibacillus alkaliphilus]|uniref:RpiR family transcriptional regulator n=1 Tax=Halolactibacillus alkaliphilus TaxID=442899 RepID=A0A511WZQ2_9BACI|nr:MurR/RpiR family transcriptional regulator [Halolactibacillus alkaliphilus]GEN56175.1 RpiR family transcriptional regulator [Halolactibacillus alkaliphilus]GGN66752.1 RpiR family transcriptional regulator [Halolactibacillus alkaliphilus]SFO72224.1 transcriptional regulator, RpiR family [Halolactibacillus alkaliphilus]
MASVLKVIQLKYQKLSKSEKRVADYLLEHYSHVSNMDIRELAEKAAVSVATVTRFSHKVGMASFVELKISLRDAVKKDERPDDVLYQVQQTYNEVLIATSTLQTIENYQRVVDRLNQAKSISIFCIGSSGLSGEEFKLRLRRMGKSVDTFLDAHSMVLRASTLTSEDVVIAISASGQTLEIVEAAKLAHKNNAAIVSLTNYEKTALTTLSAEVIYTHHVDGLLKDRVLNTQLSVIYVIDSLTALLMEDEENALNYHKTLDMLSSYLSEKKIVHALNV